MNIIDFIIRILLLSYELELDSLYYIMRYAYSRSPFI